MKYIINCIHLLVLLTTSMYTHSMDLQTPNEITPDDQKQTNLLNTLSENNLGVFQWINKPAQLNFHEGKLTIVSREKTDFFIDPENGKSSGSAPVLYREVSGNFIATALIEPGLNHTWNAGSLMVFIDSENWIKFAFEKSDATGNSIVSVVTRKVSDDANGVRLHDAKKVWLKLIRKNDIYAMHWSQDGKKYHMARLAKMPSAKTVKVGLEAQSPLKNQATHIFHYFSIKDQTVKNLRTGS